MCILMGLYSYTRAMFVIQNFEPGANIFGPEWPISPSLHALAETTFYAFKACVLPPFHAVGQDQADGQACLFCRFRASNFSFMEICSVLNTVQNTVQNKSGQLLTVGRPWFVQSIFYYLSSSYVTSKP